MANSRCILANCFTIRILSVVCSVIIGLTTGVVNAQQAPSSYQQCVACHGENAQGNTALNAPALAGQSAAYIARQLHNFASGIRGSNAQDQYGQQMLTISQQLAASKDIPALSQYLATLPAVKNRQTSEGDLKNGSRYYQAKCGACHGGQAQGNEAFNAPKLAGQDLEYLSRQMAHFVKGVRGTHAKDKLGRQMAMMAKTTAGKELADILHFIAVQEQ